MSRALPGRSLPAALLPAVTRSAAFIFTAILLFSAALPAALGADDGSVSYGTAENYRTAAAVSAGCTLDVTPSGVEQAYLILQAELSVAEPSGLAAASLKPSFSFNGSSFMFRLPAAASLHILSLDTGTPNAFGLSAYCGAGPEYYYASERGGEFSPLLTCGLRAELGQYFLDIPASAAFREGNTDSDITATAGIEFDL